jgi:hypothetical protein
LKAIVLKTIVIDKENMCLEVIPIPDRDRHALDTDPDPDPAK